MTAEGHLSEAELAGGLPQVRQSPADGGTVVEIVVRPDRDLRELPPSCTVTPESGIPADRWSRHCTHQLPDGRLNPETQLTLMNTRCLALVAGGRDRWALAGDLGLRHQRPRLLHHEGRVERKERLLRNGRARPALDALIGHRKVERAKQRGQVLPVHQAVNRAAAIERITRHVHGATTHRQVEAS